MRRTVQPVIVLFVVLTLCGCLPAATLRTGKPIREELVRTITPGKTTKSDLFERFGAPAAIVARDEIAVISSFSVWSDSFRKESSYGFDADTLYQLFPTAGESAEYRRIYYHHHVESRKEIYFLVLGLYENASTTTDRLWCLVNEKTRIVEDYAFKKSGSTLHFGIPRNNEPR